MEAFLAQVAAAAGKASDQGYSKQGRPPVQPKSAAAGRPVKKEGVRQRSPSAPARNRARNSHEEPNTHKHKMLDWQAAPNSAIRVRGSLGGEGIIHSRSESPVHFREDRREGHEHGTNSSWVRSSV